MGITVDLAEPAKSVVEDWDVHRLLLLAVAMGTALLERAVVYAMEERSVPIGALPAVITTTTMRRKKKNQVYPLSYSPI